MGTKPKLEVNIHETTILFYTVGIESYKRVGKKIQYQKIFHIEWKFRWIFENNEIFSTQVFETVCTYAQINTSKPKIKAFSFFKVSKMVLLNFQPKNKKKQIAIFSTIL